MTKLFKLSIFNFQCSIILIACFACTPYRYLSIEIRNPAAITFPQEMRRLLIVNNALPQGEVPFESTIRAQPEDLAISADSAAYDFCRTLGEVLAGFEGFDDVRLLEGCLRKDVLPLEAPVLKREQVELICDEHETDVIISLDRLLFRINENEVSMFGFEIQDVIGIEVSGVLRVYAPGRESPLTSIFLKDTVIPDIVGYEYDYEAISPDLFFSAAQPDLLRESAIYLAEKARKHFIPYWEEDVRWYYTSFETRWKEATAYAESEKWDKALDIWKELYERVSSWKQQARLCANIALALEMTERFDQALPYAQQSHQLMLDHLGADDAAVKKQETYVKVLSSRITESQKLQMQIN